REGDAMKLSLNLPRDNGRLTSLATRLRLTSDRRASGQDLETASEVAIGATAERTIDPLPSWYLEARRHVQRHAWGHAQRALEKVPPDQPDHPARQDLASVRRIRRAIRRTSRWPSDVDAHIDLGQAYFDLDLAEEALAEFNLVQHLAPERHEGYVL